MTKTIIINPIAFLNVLRPLPLFKMRYNRRWLRGYAKAQAVNARK